jgi:hypothetical protein
MLATSQFDIENCVSNGTQRNNRKEPQRMVRLQMALLVLLLTGCGTFGGIANGTGEVLEGVATDARSLGSMIQR